MVLPALLLPLELAWQALKGHPFALIYCAGFPFAISPHTLRHDSTQPP